MSAIKESPRSRCQQHALAESLPRRVVVVRALPGLGDWLCVVPALRALRAALQDTHIALIGLLHTQSLVERFAVYVDELIAFPGYPGIVERTPAVRELPDFFSAMQGRFDLALQMHGSGIYSTPFTVLLGARYTAGFYLPGQYCPDEVHFLPYPAHEPEVWRHLRLMQCLGVPLQGDELEFPLTEADWQALYSINQTHDLRPSEYVCLHAGASRPQRCWQPERFAAVADRLVEVGLQVVLTGTAAESERAQAVAQAMTHEAVNLTGRTTLGGMAALLSDARLLVCNDTGISHLAAALRVPSVVVFLASEVHRWAPLDRERHRVVGCFGDDSAGQVGEAAVLAQVHDLLRREGAHVA